MIQVAVVSTPDYRSTKRVAEMVKAFRDFKMYSI